jgi:sec-independent protein translocase protein TatA
MFGFGHTPELLMLLVVAVVIFGPRRVPQIAASLGKTVKAFRSETAELRNEALSVRHELVSTLDIDGPRGSSPGAPAIAGAGVQKEVAG